MSSAGRRRLSHCWSGAVWRRGPRRAHAHTHARTHVLTYAVRGVAPARRTVSGAGAGAPRPESHSPPFAGHRPPARSGAPPLLAGCPGNPCGPTPDGNSVRPSTRSALPSGRPGHPRWLVPIRRRRTLIFRRRRRSSHRLADLSHRHGAVRRGRERLRPDRTARSRQATFRRVSRPAVSFPGVDLSIQYADSWIEAEECISFNRISSLLPKSNQAATGLYRPRVRPTGPDQPGCPSLPAPAGPAEAQAAIVGQLETPGTAFRPVHCG